MTTREYKGSKARSRDFVLVALFFARCGDGKPPTQLGVTRWGEAYQAFFQKLADGRTETAFRNSMKNARDEFDSHLRGDRVGWKEGPTQKPRALSPVSLDILNQWRKRSDDELWAAVRAFRTSVR